MTQPQHAQNVVILRLPVGDQVLEIEQAPDLGDFARQAVRSGTDPYWAYLWPSARALVEFISTRDLRGLTVLEIGAGLGAPGLAAALRGAEVTLSDLREAATTRAQHNGVRNQLEVQTRVIDWNAPPVDLPQFNRILASDVLYDDGMLRGILRFAKGHLAHDGILWLTDPMRIPETGIRGAAALCGFEVRAMVAVDGLTHTGGVTLFEVKRRRGGSRPARTPATSSEV